MGRGWIMGYKGEQAAKKGNLFTKLSKEIAVAARLGGPDPDSNARLRTACDEARANSMPRDTIERAIKKGSGTLEGVSYEDVVYEGYAPHGVAVLIEALTDNKNRTVSELKSMFKESGGSFGAEGSVAWMFNRVGHIEATKGKLPEDLEGEAIEVSAEAVEAYGNGTVAFTTRATDLDVVKHALADRGWHIAKAELSFEAKNKATLTDAQKKHVIDFLAELTHHDDIRHVHPAL